MADFWGWLLGSACAATLLQIATFGYCLHVYLRNFLKGDEDVPQTQQSHGSAGPNFQGSARSQTVRRFLQL